MPLPKSLTTITPLSKLVALFLFIFLPFIGFYLGLKYQKLTTAPQSFEWQNSFDNIGIVLTPTPPEKLPSPSINLFCKVDTDCPAKMKCKNQSCVDVGCLKEGEVGPSAGINPENRKHIAVDCCQGLEGIAWPKVFNQDCSRNLLVGAPTGICTKCGNGTCEKGDTLYEWETKCNCPEDCR